MADVYICVSVIILLQCFLCIGFILSNGNRTTLPQYAKYGKSMVLVGGNLEDNNTEIYDTIVQMAGGKGVAKIGIINAASADPQGGYIFYRDMFLRYGALEANRIPIDLNHTYNNRNHSVIVQISQQTGFFFGGGDQYRIIQSFLSMSTGHYSDALKALHAMYDVGAVIAGTSAGTTCQTANYMMRSGASWEALRYGASDRPWPPGGENNLVYEEFGGLGFVKNYITGGKPRNYHEIVLTQRGREGRMIRLLADTKNMTKGTPHGFGIDEDTALVITHGDTNHMNARVIGSSGVSFFDLSKLSIDSHSTYFSIRDVYMTYLTHGDAINLNDRSVSFSVDKVPVRGSEEYDHALTTTHVFQGGSFGSGRKPEFVRLASSIYDAKLDRTTSGTTFKTNPKFIVRLSRTGYNSEAWVQRKHSFHSDVLSYTNMYVEIVN